MKNIVSFDIETTGLDKTKDYIIQFAAIKYDRETGNMLDSMNLYIQPEGGYTITIQAYMKHKISPEFLKDKPYFFEVADDIIAFIKDCDILTYNGNTFDIAFLISEMKRVNRDIDFMQFNCYDAFLEEKRRNGIGLNNTYKRYTGKTMEESGLEAHDAFSDVKATFEIFQAQQRIKEYGPEVMFGEDNFITNSEFNGEMVPCFSMGKYKTLPISYISTIDQGYLNWCVGTKSTLTESTKNYIKTYIKEE